MTMLWNTDDTDWDEQAGTNVFVKETDTSTADMDFVIDEDNMASDSATKVPTQQSTKAYADGKVADAINNGTTTVAPSQNAVFDALALKGTAVIEDWQALGNLGATETVTGVDDHIVRAAGTLDQACTVTVAMSADQLVELLLTQDGTGGRAVTWSGVDVWLTQLGTAPDLSTAPAGVIHQFRFLDVAGTTYGQWWTEPPVEAFSYAIGDETTAITTGTAKVTFRAPFACSLVAVRASLTTVSSSGTPTFDVNESGTTLLSTKLTVDASEKTSTTAATPAVISDNLIADDAEMTIDVDVAGTGATGAKITLYLRRR